MLYYMCSCTCVRLSYWQECSYAYTSCYLAISPLTTSSFEVIYKLQNDYCKMVHRIQQAGINTLPWLDCYGCISCICIPVGKEESIEITMAQQENRLWNSNFINQMQ